MSALLDLATQSLLAHGGEEHGSAWSGLLRQWTGDPLVIALLVISTVWYALGIKHVRRWEAAVYFAGIVSVVIALLSPLDALSDVLFAAHMSQHEVLMLISAPLLVLGRPLIAFLWALPLKTREQVGALVTRPGFKATWRAFTHPFVVVVVHAVAVWIWHIPSLFEAALASETVHTFQHASFFITASLFWWAMLHGRYGRIGYGVAVAYVFATALHTGLLGALATIAKTVWYPTYADRAPALGVDALEDQQLAGLIMWVPAGILFLVLALALVAAWLGEAQRRVGYGRADALSGSPAARKSS